MVAAGGAGPRRRPGGRRGWTSRLVIIWGRTAW